MPNRWVIAIAGTVVMVTIGCLYSWGLFTQPLLVAYGWDLRTTTWAYAIANFSLAAVGAVIGGFWQDRAGPRKVAMVGVALWGLGNVLAGLGTSSLGAPWLYATYGIMGGIGAGMAYITPVAMVTKWFPDRKGLAGGLVAAGFGLGAFVYNLLVPRLAGFHAAALHAGGFPRRESGRDEGSRGRCWRRSAAPRAGANFYRGRYRRGHAGVCRPPAGLFSWSAWPPRRCFAIRRRVTAWLRQRAWPANQRSSPIRPRKFSRCRSFTCCGCSCSSMSSAASPSSRMRCSSLPI